MTLSHQPRSTVCFDFIAPIRIGTEELRSPRNRSLPLLDHVSKFMPKDRPAFSRSRGGLAARRQDDVLSDGKGRCVCRAGGMFIGVQTHRAEIVAEPVLHECARIWIERLAGIAHSVFSL
jgi:hypothetical protein